MASRSSTVVKQQKEREAPRGTRSAALGDRDLRPLMEVPAGEKRFHPPRRFHTIRRRRKLYEVAYSDLPSPSNPRLNHSIGNRWIHSWQVHTLRGGKYDTVSIGEHEQCTATSSPLCGCGIPACIYDPFFPCASQDGS